MILGVLTLAAAAHCTEYEKVPGFPPTPPGAHYVICGQMIDPSEMDPSDRLEGTCDFAEDILSDLKSAKSSSKKLQYDVEMLHSFACDPPKSK